MKFKGMMLVTLVLLAILTIGAVSASDDADALAADDTGDAIVEAPAEDASLEAGETDDVLQGSVNVALEDEISSADDLMATVTDSSKVYGTVTVFLNGTQVAERFFGGSYSTEKMYANKIAGSFEGTYNLKVVYHSGNDDKDYSNEGVVTFINHVENKLIPAEAFNFTLVNTEVDVKSETTPIITFLWPDGTVEMDQIELDIIGEWKRGVDKKEGATSGIITLGDLYIFDPGTFEFTAYYRANDGYKTKLSNGTFRVTKTFTPNDFIELYDKEVTGPTDYVCNVYDSYGNLNGEVTVLANNTQVYYSKFTGTPQAIRINVNNLTGDLKGAYNIIVIYKRTANGKEYSKLATVTFPGGEPVVPDTRPMITFKPTADDITYGNTARVNIKAADGYGNVNKSVSGNVLVEVLYFNGIKYVNVGEANVAIKNGAGLATFSNLNASEYLISLSANDTDAYKANVYSTDLKVTPADVYVEGLQNINLEYGSSINITVSAEGATGISAEVDGSPITVDGFVIPISGLDLGNHILKVTPITDSNHNPVAEQATITVKKADSSINASDVTIYGGEPTNVTVSTEGATGITAKIDGNDAAVNGDVISIPALALGTHLMSITTIPDANHEAVTVNVTITIKKSKSTVSLSSNNLTFDYNKSAKCEVTFDNATGIKAEIDGYTNVVSVEGNVITVANLTPGNYVLKVTTVVDDAHESATATANVTVNKLKTGISVDDKITFDYKSSASTQVISDAKLKAEIPGITGAVVTIVDGVLTVSGLNAGNYTLVISTDDELYEPVTKDVSVIVNKIATGISLKDNNITFDYGSSGSTQVSSDANLKGEVSGQPKATVTIKDGVITVSGLACGNYTLVISTDDANYEPASANVNVTVNQLSTSISATKVTTTYGTSKTMTVTLKSNGNPVAGKKVTVVINGKTLPGTTNEKGQASIAVPKTLAVKNSYAATVTFAGDENYTQSTVKTSVVVNKATPKFVYKTAVTLKRTDKNKKYTVTLKTDKNAVYKNAKVTIKVNGKTYSGKTNAKGQYTFKLTKLTKKGKFTATLKFVGDAKYKAISKSVKITVK